MNPSKDSVQDHCPQLSPEYTPFKIAPSDRQQPLLQTILRGQLCASASKEFNLLQPSRNVQARLSQPAWTTSRGFHPRPTPRARRVCGTLASRPAGILRWSITVLLPRSSKPPYSSAWNNNRDNRYPHSVHSNSSNRLIAQFVMTFPYSPKWSNEIVLILCGLWCELFLGWRIWHWRTNLWSCHFTRG